MSDHTLMIYHGSRFVTVEVPPDVFRLHHADVELCFGCFWKTSIKMFVGNLLRALRRGEYADVGVVFCPACAEEFERILASDNGSGSTST